MNDHLDFAFTSMPEIGNGFLTRLDAIRETDPGVVMIKFPCYEDRRHAASRPKRLSIGISGRSSLSSSGAKPNTIPTAAAAERG